MTMETVVISTTHPGNGSAKDFDTEFRFLVNSQVGVSIVDDASGDTDAVLTLNVDYTVTGRLNPTGGAVHLIGDWSDDPPATGKTVKIDRVTPMIQLLDLRSQINYDPAAVEAALDYLMQVCQEIDGNATGVANAFNERLDEVFQGQRLDYPIACSTRTTALAVNAKVGRVRVPHDFRIIGLLADLGTAQASGSILTLDCKVNGVSILDTLLTIDNGQTTSALADTPYVFDGAADYIDIDAGNEVTWAITQVNASGTARWLQCNFWGYPLL